MFRSIRWRRADQSEATCRSRGYDAAMVSIKGVTSYPGPTPRYIRTTSTKPRQVGLFAPLASVGTVGREQDVCGDEIRHVFRSLTLRDNRTSTLGIIQHFRNSKSHSAARGTQHAFASASRDGGEKETNRRKTEIDLFFSPSECFKFVSRRRRKNRNRDRPTKRSRYHPFC